MQQVTVKVFGALQERFGRHARTVPLRSATTLRDLLAALASTDSDLVAKLKAGLEEGYLNVLINGRNARFLNGDDTRLKPGDVVAFLPPIGGG